jgi:very-short-patch-repair endonuclease
MESFPEEGATPATVQPSEASPDRQLAELAGSQFGAFSHAQLRGLGLTRNQISAHLASGAWDRLHPGVYKFGATPATRALMASAGLLYAGDDAWFSHATAARLHGIDPRMRSTRVWITVPATVQRASTPGLRITRSRRIAGFTTMTHRQPVLTPERTLVDLAAILDMQEYQRVLYDAIGRRLVTIDGVLAAAEDFGGKPGVAQVHQAATDFDPAYESSTEDECGALLSGAGLIFERQLEIWEDGILLARIDFGDEVIKLGYEVDGMRYHGSVAARAYDRERDRALRLRGWQIERFTTDDIRRRPIRTQRAMVAIHRQRAADYAQAS